MCPNEAEEKDLLESDRLKAVANLQKYQEEIRTWRDHKGKTTIIRCRKSGTFVKPLY
jgi:CCR4-NOT transcriptional regulation complex NOT5 subunit